MYLNKRSIQLMAIIIYALSAIIAYILPIQLAIPGLPMSILLSFCVFAVMMLLIPANFTPILKHNFVRIIAITLLVPLAASFLLIPINVVIPDSFTNDPSISLREAITRIINILLNFSIFSLIIVRGVDKYGKSYGRAILIIYYLALILLMIGGVWQIASKLLGIPFPEMGLRTNFHGVDSGVKESFGFRITSFLAEPSYFAPYIIDFILVGLILLKSWFVRVFVTMVSTLILASTFSMSGILNISILGLVLAVAYIHKKRITYLSDLYQVLGLTILITTLAVLSWQAIDYLMPYYERFNAFVATGDDKRFYIITRAYDTLTDSLPHAVMFGFGPGSFTFFKYLADPMEGTSNNLYVDIMLEHGFFGLLLILVLFSYLIFKTYRMIGKKFENTFGFLFVVHLAVTSMYRADYASPRFWIILVIIYILINYGDMPAEAKEKRDYKYGFK
jgi:hypothetical protein